MTPGSSLFLGDSSLATWIEELVSAVTYVIILRKHWDFRSRDSVANKVYCENFSPEGTTMSEVVGAEHAFHDVDYAADWARRFQPTPERLHLFETIGHQLQETIPEDGHVVELGIGPAYLAEFLLERMPNISYEGVDFSQPMLTQAAARLARFGGRVRFLQADLLGDSWGGDLARTPAAIVSTWALHDLGGQSQTLHVYRACEAALPEGGILLNGDFIKPDGTRLPFEPGRFPIDRHLELLLESGFSDRRCLHLWEEETEEPTASQNYACLVGRV